MCGCETSQRARSRWLAWKMLSFHNARLTLQEEDRKRSQEAGFNAHLVKAVDLDVDTLLAFAPGP